MRSREVGSAPRRSSRRAGEVTIRNHWPEARERIHGRKLLPRQSRERDRQIFERTHADDWIVIAAVRPEFRQGFTEVIATRGGKRGERVDQRRFLIPVEEYDSEPFGFVIDEVRHPIGPSSFMAIGDDLRGRLEMAADGHFPPSRRLAPVVTDPGR